MLTFLSEYIGISVVTFFFLLLKFVRIDVGTDLGRFILANSKFSNREFKSRSQTLQHGLNESVY